MNRTHTTTIADALHSDPRLVEARRLVHEALTEHQGALTGPRDADPALADRYRALLEQFGELRGGGLYFPYLGSGVGRGPLVELADGGVKYDMICGIGVHYFGHNHPALLDAGLDAAVRDTVMQGNLQQNVESARVAETMVNLATRRGAKLRHCFLTSSGAMANENALKLAFHHHAPADRLLAFSRGFAGRTLVLAQVTDKPAGRAGLPKTVAVDYVPFFDPAQPKQSTADAVAQLKAHLHSHPGKHAAMIFELVQGEGGYYAGTRDFFTALMDVLRDAGVAILIDEIQTFARLTEPFAFQHFALDQYADLVTVGKMTQLCFTLFADDYKPPKGLVSQTFTGSASAIFAAQRILDTLDAGGYFGKDGRIMRLSKRFIDRLEAISAAHPHRISGPFGIGGMIAFTPFDGSADAAKQVLMQLYDNGVIAFIAGGNPTRIRFLPPIAALDERDVDAVCDIIDKTLAEVAGRIGK